MPIIISPEEIEATIQWVRWGVVLVFFVLTTLAWWAASKEWAKEEQADKQLQAIPHQEEGGNIHASESRS